MFCDLFSAVGMVMHKSSRDEERAVDMRVRQGCDQIVKALCLGSCIKSERDFGSCRAGRERLRQAFRIFRLCAGRFFSPVYDFTWMAYRKDEPDEDRTSMRSHDAKLTTRDTVSLLWTMQSIARLNSVFTDVDCEPQMANMLIMASTAHAIAAPSAIKRATKKNTACTAMPRPIANAISKVNFPGFQKWSYSDFFHNTSFCQSKHNSARSPAITTRLLRIS